MWPGRLVIVRLERAWATSKTYLWNKNDEVRTGICMSKGGAPTMCRGPTSSFEKGNEVEGCISYSRVQAGLLCHHG